MTNYPKIYTIRYALWRAYSMKCFYCGMPIDFQNLTIDHLIPQSLEKDQNRLDKILKEYDITDIYPDFSPDDLLNLVPSHGNCNVRKSDDLLPKEVTLYYLTRINKKLPKVVYELDRLRISSQKGNILGRLGALLESGEISEQEVIETLSQWDFRRTSDEPLVITFGLDFIDTLQMRGIIEEAVQISYVTMCDQFELELVDLLRSTIHNSFHYSEPSYRDGENLSVRLVFPELQIGDVESLPLDYISELMPWWEILEVRNFYRLYGYSYQEFIDPKIE
ncbi:MAG: HNH endonuclease [Candidatus Kariarchaeaceae archaeon]